MCINLNRFTMDFMTGERKKLNNRLVFPPVIDMDKFLEKSSKGEELSKEDLKSIE